MGPAPLAHPVNFLVSSPVIAIGRTSGPSSLVGRLAGLLALGLGTEALVVPITRIGNEQLFTVTTFAPAVVHLHVTPRGMLPQEENGKPRRRNRPRRITTVRKKEEQFKGEEPEENRSRRWPPFRRPRFGHFSQDRWQQ
jgi:hypothetical protein